MIQETDWVNIPPETAKLIPKEQPARPSDHKKFRLKKK
jgi:hypothetical protein